MSNVPSTTALQGERSAPHRATLFVERGFISPEQLKGLLAQGYHVCQVVSVDKVKSIGEVPLRDYFAAAAMTGFLANSYSDGMNKPLSLATKLDIAELAYGQAEAMLLERDKPTTETKG